MTGTFTCTAVLAAVVFRRQFRWPRSAALGVFGFFFLIDITFFSANTIKVIEGGWVPLVFALALMALMTSWKRGRDLLLARWKQDSLPLASFLARLPQSRTVRVPGLAVFLTGNPDYVPAACCTTSSTTRCCTSGCCSSPCRTWTCRRWNRTPAGGRRNWRRASTGSSCATGSWKARTYRAPSKA